MRDISYRDGKIRFQSETETEYDTDQPEEKVAPSAMQKPVFVVSLKNFKLMEGADATFVCRLTGRPKPKVLFIMQRLIYSMMF